jgi:hypothetical protein
MARAPELAAEAVEFLSETYGREVEPPIRAVYERWTRWREERALPPGANHERLFRQLLDRLEAMGLLAIDRSGGSITRLRLVAPPPPGYAERIRRLRRERAIARGGFANASPDAGEDLPDTRTPTLNAYVRRRRAAERAREELERAGLDASSLADQLDPLGEEALALKERSLRVELELRAWRAAGARLGFGPDPLEEPAPPVAASKTTAKTPPKPARAATRARTGA